MKDEIKLIPINQIRILNPRHRDKKKFELITESIKNLGLKKPIKISIRSAKKDAEPQYDLVCGQGRIEAFTALGYTAIPAVVVDVPRSERLLMSLVENMARRFSAPMDLINEIERLKTEGYSNVAIGKKLDISDTTIGGLIALKKAGEERLLQAALRGGIPFGVAMDIAKTDGVDTQRELLKAYENKQLNQNAIRKIKRLIEQRRFFGKKQTAAEHVRKPQKTADGFVSAYRRETQRQKQLVRKVKLCEARLLFVVNAFMQLRKDENFVNLLRAEKLTMMPKCLSDKLKVALKEAA